MFLVAGLLGREIRDDELHLHERVIAASVKSKCYSEEAVRLSPRLEACVTEPTYAAGAMQPSLWPLPYV